MKSITAHFTGVLLGVAALSGVAATPPVDFSAQRTQVLALGGLVAPPVVHPAEAFAADGAITPLFFEGLPWKGKPTRVFAWLGLPENAGGKKLPGIVLVHGGGGTAFKEWVKKWNDRGFAAISIAVDGQTERRSPTEPKTQSNPTGWERHAWAGPARNGIYGDSAEPLADQWMYHAVADTILANSLLRSRPEVDASKVGVMGISWGGVITSTVIGLDARFAFAIPTYGCGHLFDAANQYGRALGQNERYKHVWDPMVWLNRARLPVMWFSWPEDQHFPLDAQAASYRAAPGPRLVALIPGLKHSHGAAWNPLHSYGFAESVVNGGKPWGAQLRATVENGVARAEFESTKPLDRAQLISTTETGITGGRKWTESPAALEKSNQGWSVSAPLPAGTTAWFINAHSGALVISSDFQEHSSSVSALSPPPPTAVALTSFNWDRVPLNLHFGKRTADMTEAEINFVADHSRLIALEKGHGAGAHGSTEAGIADTARRLKQRNPAVKVLFYFNAFINWSGYDAFKTYRPEWTLRDTDGKIVTHPSGTPRPDPSNADFRAWWSDVIAAANRTSALDGVFVDALPQAISPALANQVGDAKARAVVQGLREMLALTKRKLGPDRVVLANGLRTTDFRDILDWEGIDGVMIEHFGAFKTDAPADIKADLDSFALAAAKGKFVVLKGWPGFNFTEKEAMQRPYAELLELARERITFPLACFLVAAQPGSHFCYSWGYTDRHGMLDAYPELERPLGPPQGDAIWRGLTATREFAHASVWVDIGAKQARIEWR